VDEVSESLLELNDTVSESEERVITASAYVVTSVVGASTLTNEDVPRTNNFTAELLNTEALSCAVSSVSGTSYRFLMCHDITLNFQISLLEGNTLDNDLALVLAMTLLLGVTTLKTLLEDNDLLVSLVSDKTSSNRYAKTLAISGKDLDLTSTGLSSHENVRERDLVTRVALDSVDRDLRSRANLVLLARCANDCEYLRLLNYCSFFFLCHTAYTFTGYNFTGFPKSIGRKLFSVPYISTLLRWALS
jgi:hypothetical protein